MCAKYLLYSSVERPFVSISSLLWITLQQTSECRCLLVISFSLLYTQKWDYWMIWWFYFSLDNEPPAWSVFHSGWSISHSYLQCTRVPFSAHPISCFIDGSHSIKCNLTFLTGIKWYLIVIWICTFLMTVDIIFDVEHLFIYLLANCMSSWEICLYIILCPLFSHCFLAVDLYEFLIYIGQSPLSDWYEVCKYFLQCHRLSFNFSDFLILLKFNFSFLINSLILLFVTHTNLWNTYLLIYKVFVRC